MRLHCCSWRLAGPLRRSALFAVALGLAAACSKGDGAAPAPSASVAVLPEAPEPAGLLAELYLPKPTQTWAALRALFGGPAALLPSSFALLAGSALGLSPLAAGDISGDVSVVGVVVDAAAVGGSPDIVLGLHVVSGPELIAKLSSGADAAFEKSVDASSGVALLVPRGAKASRDLALGVLGNYLLAAHTTEALTRAGPFVAGTLPGRTPPSGAFSVVAREPALHGRLAARLRDLWKAYQRELDDVYQLDRNAKGRPPDFAEPAAALVGAATAAESVAQLLESATRVDVALEPSAERLVLSAELVPAAEGAAHGYVRDLSVGDLAPLLALPSGVAAALVARSTSASRAAAAKTTLEGFAQLFGDRLKAADREKLAAVLSALSGARGDSLALALLPGTDNALLLRAPVSDEKAFDAGVVGGFKLLGAPVFADPIERYLGKLTVKDDATNVPGIEGKAHRVKLSLQPTKDRKAAPPQVAAPAAGSSATPKAGPRIVQCLWLVRDGQGQLVIGAEPANGLLALLVPGAENTLGASPVVAEAAQRAGKEVAFALLLRPAWLGVGAPSPTAAPALIVVGRAEGHASLRVEIGREAVQQLTRRLIAP